MLNRISSHLQNFFANPVNVLLALGSAIAVGFFVCLIITGAVIGVTSSVVSHKISEMESAQAQKIFLEDPNHFVGHQVYIPGAKLVEGRDDFYTLEGNPLILSNAVDAGKMTVVEVHPGDHLGLLTYSPGEGNESVTFTIRDQYNRPILPPGADFLAQLSK